MRNLQQHPITSFEIEACLQKLAQDFGADRRMGDMRPLLLREAMKLVVASRTEPQADPNRKPANAVGQLIQHPSEKLTLQQRARQIWCVHPEDLAHIGFSARETYLEAHILAAIRQAGGEAPTTREPINGLAHIMHPSVEMTPKERASQMVRVEPQDLDAFNMLLEEFYAAHLAAAVRQVGCDPDDYWSAGENPA